MCLRLSSDAAVGEMEWLDLVIHPQTGGVCYPPYSHGHMVWPEDGFLHSLRDLPTVWPVPRLKDARLVDCAVCRKTGIQARNIEAVARYLPGTAVEEGKLIFRPLGMGVYPTGSGEDEEYVPPPNRLF
jgi:hypothetical protein